MKLNSYEDGLAEAMHRIAAAGLPLGSNPQTTPPAGWLRVEGRVESCWLWAYDTLGLWLDGDLLVWYRVERHRGSPPAAVMLLTPEEQALVRLAGASAIEPPLAPIVRP